MRVAYICADPGIPVFGSKGASVHVQEVVRAFLRRGDQVTLFTPRTGGAPPTDLRAVRVVELIAAEGKGVDRQETSALRLDTMLAASLVEHEPFDLVYERYSLWSWSAAVAARRAGLPVVLEVNSPLIDEQETHRGPVNRARAVKATRRVFAAASTIVAVSTEAARWVEGFPEATGKVHVVPNGVDLTRFNMARRPQHLDQFVVGFVGTLKPWHDLDTLLRAFALLVEADQSYRLVVVGDGPQRPAIADRSREMGLAGRVQFTGAVEPAAIPRLMEGFDLAVAPYPALDGFYFSPLKIFEYMAAGLPVVAADIGQIAEIIQPGATGLLYPPGDAETLAAMIRGLRSDPNQRVRIGTAGRRAMEGRSWDDVVRRIVGLAGLGGDSDRPGQRTDIRSRAVALLAAVRRVPWRAAWRALREGLRRFRRAGGVFRPHLRGQWRLVAAGVAAMLGEIVLRLLEPWPLKFILDRVIQPASGEAVTGVAWADRLDPMSLLALSAVAVVVITGLRALSAYGATVAFALAGNRVLTAVRARLYRHLQRLSLSFHSQARSGDLITRLTGDVGRLQEVVVTAALPLGVNVFTFVGMLAVMLWMDWRLTLIALVAVPFFGITMKRLNGRIRTVARKQRQVEGALASVAAESLGAIEVVQAYSLEEPFEESFGSQNQASLRDGVQASRLAAALERKTDLFVAVGTGLVLYFGAQLVIAGTLTPGDLIVFVTYLKNAFKPMRDIAKYSSRLAKGAASAERISELLKTDTEIRDKPGALTAPAFRGDIRFDNVTLQYRAGIEVIAGLDLHLPAGSKVALIGPSGTGKSSLVGLLLRLYRPDAGRITIDGYDIADLTLDSLRRQIAVVLQDSVLFRTSLKDNIAFGDLDADDDQIEAAARLANAHHFITALPEGYDSVVGERGATLSGGERQRIAIARAALRDAPILILDEPTTGLDGEARTLVMDALERLMAGRTVIHITHDLTAITSADLIIYLEGGRIRQAGTHHELVRAVGPYNSAFAQASSTR